MRISDKAQAVKGSVTLIIDSMAKQMKAEGKSVIGFGAGEPDFNTPQHIIDAAAAAMAAGNTKYTPAAGTLELRRAICNRYAEKGLDYQPDCVVVGTGAKQVIHNSLMCLLNDGDEVILPSPCWVSYAELIQMAGGKPVFVPGNVENGFKPGAADMERAITPRTKCILINSPCNPSGSVYSEAELRAIADIAIKHDLVVISDEIYENLVYGAVKTVSIAGFGEDIKKRTVIINGVSKTYAMTGWRLGYSLCEPELAANMVRWQSHATGNTCSVTQAAALAALTGPQQCVEDMRLQFEKRRDYMVQRINGVEGISCPTPDGAFYVMADITRVKGKRCGNIEIKGSDDFAKALLEKKGVALVPCAAFGTDDYVRLSYATSMADIEEGTNRIEEFVKLLE